VNCSQATPRRTPPQLHVNGTVTPADDDVQGRTAITAFRAATRGRRVPGVSAYDVSAVLGPAAAAAASTAAAATTSLKATVVIAEDAGAF
jgi:hypothetical protein